MIKTIAACAVLALAVPAAAQTASGLPPSPGAPLIDIYKALHAHPELSRQEVETSAFLARELRAAGYTVTDHIGVYDDGARAYGVVGVLKNGAGPTLLIRTDMDGLPVTEETGLPYASKARGKDEAGQDTGLMHACGHDIHMTVFIGVARNLAAAKGQWRGTLILVGQPAEERVQGARAMLADRLYERFGRPDMIVGLHDTNTSPAGKVEVISGPAMAGSTAVDVTLKGIGGHGARPNEGRDVVVMAAQFIQSLQTIVSREQDPLDPAVVTVGSIHAGTKRNIIPDEVKLGLTTRSFSDRARQTTLDGIRARAAGVALAAGLPPERAPVVTVLEGESTPSQYNDPALTARVRPFLVAALGADNVVDAPPMMASEDVGVFGGADRKIPVVFYRLGAMNAEAFAAAKAQGRILPGLHTSRFQPDPEPTVQTGVKAMTAVAVGLLK